VTATIVARSTHHIECEARTGESVRKTPKICRIDIDAGYVCGDGRVHVLQAVPIGTSDHKHRARFSEPKRVGKNPIQRQSLAYRRTAHVSDVVGFRDAHPRIYTWSAIR